MGTSCSRCRNVSSGSDSDSAACCTTGGTGRKPQAAGRMGAGRVVATAMAAAAVREEGAVAREAAATPLAHSHQP